MALTISAPTNGILPLSIRLPQHQVGSVLAATPLPSGVTVAAPTDGVLPILGAVVMGQVDNGQFVQSLP